MKRMATAAATAYTENDKSYNLAFLAIKIDIIIVITFSLIFFESILKEMVILLALGYFIDVK